MSENVVYEPAVDGIFTGKPDIPLEFWGNYHIFSTENGNILSRGHMSHYITIMCITQYYTTTSNHHIKWRMLDNFAKGWQVKEFCHPGESLAKHQHKMTDSFFGLENCLSSLRLLNHLCAWLVCFIYPSLRFFLDDMG